MPCVLLCSIVVFMYLIHVIFPDSSAFPWGKQHGFYLHMALEGTNDCLCDSPDGTSLLSDPEANAWPLVWCYFSSADFCTIVCFWIRPLLQSITNLWVLAVNCELSSSKAYYWTLCPGTKCLKNNKPTTERASHSIYCQRLLLFHETRDMFHHTEHKGSHLEQQLVSHEEQT